MILSPRRLALRLAVPLLLPALATGCARSGTRAGGPSGEHATTAATVNASLLAASPTPALVARILTGDERGVTPDLDGATVQLAAAQVFLVQLGDGARWTLSWSPPNAVVQATSTVAPPRGSQGYFAINEPGRTVVLMATGTSSCPTPGAGALACAPGAPRTVRVTIVTVAGGGLSAGPLPATTSAATASPSPPATAPSGPSGPEVTHAVCPGALSAAAPISVRAGQRFTIALPANQPLFSYALLVPPDAAVLKLVDMTYLRDTATGGVTGLGGVECWTFDAVALGHATLAFGIQHFGTSPPGTAPPSPDKLIDVTVQ